MSDEASCPSDGGAPALRPAPLVCQRADEPRLQDGWQCLHTLAKRYAKHDAAS